MKLAKFAFPYFQLEKMHKLVIGYIEKNGPPSDFTNVRLGNITNFILKYVNLTIEESK